MLKLTPTVREHLAALAYTLLGWALDKGGEPLPEQVRAFLVLDQLSPKAHARRVIYDIAQRLEPMVESWDCTTDRKLNLYYLIFLLDAESTAEADRLIREHCRPDPGLLQARPGQDGTERP